jgi:hypothetical protein
MKFAIVVMLLLGQRVHARDAGTTASQAQRQVPPPRSVYDERGLIVLQACSSRSYSAACAQAVLGGLARTGLMRLRTESLTPQLKRE